LRISRLVLAVAALTIFASGILPATALTAGDESRIKVAVDCHCPDKVGQKFCSDFKGKVRDSAGYRLVDSTGGYGMGVHFTCVDLWQGINNQLSGSMSAVSVTFTIFAENLPGEVYEDNSVFRVGKEATPEMSRQILAALGQLVTLNSSFFERMRTGAKRPPASSAPSGQTPGTQQP
jgi:hypothetical protein